MRPAEPRRPGGADTDEVLRSALAQVATGRADAVWAPGLQPWDCAAGVLLVLEAGGTVGDLTGPTPGTWPASGDILATDAALWTTLQKILAPVYL